MMDMTEEKPVEYTDGKMRKKISKTPKKEFLRDKRRKNQKEAKLKCADCGRGFKYPCELARHLNRRKKRC